MVSFFVLLSPGQISAESLEFTSREDWDSGTKLLLETDTKEGDLKLQADGSWGARNWRTPHLPLSVGSAFASDGTDIYMVRGVGDIYFARYSSLKDEWTKLANLPYGTFYGADMEILDGYVYLLFGGYQKTFARYSIANNSWELLPEFIDLVYDGGSIVSDGTDLYALRGYYSQNFYKYDVSERAWGPLTGPPANVFRGSDLVRVGNYLYTPRGYNQPTFYRYDIAANTWDTMADAPSVIYDDANITTDGTSIFVSRQEGLTSFYKYDIATNTWSTLADAPLASRYAGVVYHSGDGYVYFFRGNGQYNFWKYDINQNKFLGPSDMPSTITTGADLIYNNGYLYGPRGSTTPTFWRYTVATDTWDTMTDAPDTFADDTKGVLVGGYIYFYRGTNTATFWRYNISGNSWEALSDAPAFVRFGGTLSYTGSGDYIYGTRGSTTGVFWRYSISGNSWDDASVVDLPIDAEASYGSRTISDGTYIYYIAGIGLKRMFRYDIAANTWTELSNIPFAPLYGTDIAYSNGKIIALAGNYLKDVWEYTIATDSWRLLKPLAGFFGADISAYAGSSIEYDGSGSYYVTVGGIGRGEMSIYTPSSENYPSSSTWTSSVQDLGYVTSWTNLLSNETTPDDSSVTFQTRTSSDNITWTSWENVSGETIASTPQQYLQIKASLNASTDLDDTPTLHSITINYNSDSNAPNNPDTFTGSSQEINGTSLVSGASYRHTHPYFSWSGATDNEGTVAGYYVYFGGNSSADPEVDGSWQTESDYNVTSALSTGTYYLKVKTKDNFGNISATATGFTYSYTGISPAQTLFIDETSEFNGTASQTNISSDQIKLEGKDGFWLEDNISIAPGGLQYGAKNTAYVASSNKIYILKGDNTTTFYEYDIDSDTWSTLANSPSAVRMGGGVIEGPTGYLYGLAGNNTTDFWRYHIATDTWSDVDATNTPLTVYYGGSIVYDGSQYIYAMRGNNDDSFWRYDTENNTWEISAPLDFGAPTETVNNFAYLGADLAIDQTNQLIYAIPGNYRNGFSYYDINTNSWTTLANTPSSSYNGASIEYDSVTNAVYYLPGNGATDLFKYDINSGTWAEASSAPSTINYGSSMRKIGDHIYVARGGNSNIIYRYHPVKDNWQVPTRGLFGTEFQGTSYFTSSYGADFVKGDGDNYYLIRGNYADQFSRWNSETGDITKLARLPAGTFYGSNLLYDNVNSKIYFTSGVYLRKIFTYDIATDTWAEEVNDPPPTDLYYGGAMVFDQARYIYLSRGANNGALYRFDTQGESGSKWTTMATAPGGFHFGAELLLKNGYIYSLRGANQSPNSFYRYDISSNSWDDAAVADLSTNVYYGSFLADGFDGYLYAPRGGNTTEFYRYSIAEDTWSSLENAPANIHVGGSGENGNNKIFMTPGVGSYSSADGIYTFIQETANSSFAESGTYESPSHDLTGVYQWANLRVNYTTADNNTLTIQTRVSSDNSTWSNWAEVSEEKKINNNYYYKINSPASRYIQVKFTFTSADGILSGVIDDYSINYFQDLDLPSNPEDSGLNVYSDDTPGDTIVSNTWYAHSAPYFDWPDSEETNGATDTATGSGIAGYYLYFGTSDSADPQQDGTFQTDSNFTASGLTSGNTYYLRIKTKDNANNVSETTWAPFNYKYDGEGPSNIANINADPSGYSAVNSFDFSWDVASSSGAAVTSYCYKTNAESGDYATDQCITANSINGIPSYRVGANTFSVRAKDQAGNYSNYVTASYYYVDASNAPAPATNLTVTPPTNTSNAFAFDWDPPASGTYYGSASNLSYYYSINALPTAYSTTATSLTYLNAGAFATLPGENTFYLVTKDEAGNINYSSYASVNFTANTTSPGIPLNIDIADVSVKATSSWKLAISWEEPSDAGSGVQNYAVFRSIDGENFSEISTSGGISYVDVGLTQQTYYYKVKACDSTNNCGEFSEVVSLFPDGKFVTAAALTSEPAVSGITTKKAIVSWSTDRTSDSKIAYGTSTGSYLDEEVSNSDHLTSHILTLTNLSPGTTYYYITKWTDEDGNTGISDEFSFVTEPPPSTEEPITKSTGLETALIEFTSKNAAKVKIYYGESTAFGGSKEVITGAAEGTHTVELNGLIDGTKYYYKINTFDTDGEEYEGETHSFETLPRPKISDIKINQVRGTAQSTLLLDWTSNTEVSSIVTYYPTNNPSQAIDQVEVDLKSGLHRMVITNLQPQTSYSLIIKGKDVIGTLATSQVLEITTAADVRPPQISDIRVEGEIIGVGEEATAQLIVSFSTDEPATAQIEYGEGSGDTYAQKTQEDNSLTSHHLVVISGLTPSKVYHLRALSKDKENNLGVSLDKVVITPKATENALDLVITNMSEIFGFLKGS